MRFPSPILACAFACIILCAQTAPPINEEAASSSLMASVPAAPVPAAATAEPPHALRSASMFAIQPPKPRTFQVHDLVQIIVRETSQAKSSQELETKKESEYDGKIPKWPHFDLSDMLQLQLKGGNPEDNPELQLEFTKDFQGEGDYERKDDLTARLTAEIIEVLPNGNLVLEARTHIKTDEEEQTIKATGICRPADITAANTILSNQLHDLSIDKVSKGELPNSAEKGIFTKVLDMIFAF